MASSNKPPPLQMPDLASARTSLVTSPHKSVMAALEFKSTASSEDEEWENIKAKGVKRLNEDLYCCLKIERNASSSDIKKVSLDIDSVKERKRRWIPIRYITYHFYNNSQ